MGEAPDVVLGELARADLQSPVATVGDEVHRVEIAVTGQHVGYLRDAVAIAVDDDDLDLASGVVGPGEIVDELAVVGRAGVDEDDLVAPLIRLAGLVVDRDPRDRPGLGGFGYGGDGRGRIGIQGAGVDGDHGRIRGEQQPRFELFHDRTATMGIR